MYIYLCILTVDHFHSILYHSEPGYLHVGGHGTQGAVPCELVDGNVDVLIPGLLHSHMWVEASELSLMAWVYACVCVRGREWSLFCVSVLHN